KLVVGFAAETENLYTHAAAKRERKGCDWIIANNVGGTGIMGGDSNEVTLINDAGEEIWPIMGKHDVAVKLAALIAQEVA
ncbi:MAG: phosphopantothenoylcysteine decarboxylase, partial [Acidocella sp.]|nr:phosphopantothenoylcysteine decarboxylase [Acidocella sp.]